MKHSFTLWLSLLALLIAAGARAQDRTYPFNWDNATVYFMLNDRFCNGDASNDNSYGRSKNSPNGELDFQGGDLKGITQKIQEGYFDKLGVNAIWITAPYEQMHGPIGSENAWAFAGYWTKDWSQMDANMGSEADLRTMVDAAHDHGIRVVMDIVMNHTGYPTSVDDAWPSSWVRNSCEGGDATVYCPLSGLPDVRTNITSGTVALPDWLLNKWQASGIKDKELSELDAFFARTGLPRVPRYYLVKWLSDWVREFGIDGYRVDTAKHIEVDAWKTLKEEAVKALKEWKAANPAKKVDDTDFWMTGEVYGQSVYDGKNYYFSNGFDNIINFGFIGDLGSKSQEAIFSSYAAMINNVEGFNVLSYIASHDVAPYNRNNLYYAGTTLMLAPGAIQIYYGDESGRPYFSPQTYGDAGYRQFMNWSSISSDTPTKNLLAHWQKLGRFRREHISVGAGTHEKLSDSPYIFRRSYVKNGMTDKTLVVMKSESTTPFTMSVYGTYADGTVLKDYFSNTSATVSGGNVSFTTPYGMLLIGKPFEAVAQVSLAVEPQSGHFANSTAVSMSATTTVPGASVSIYYTLDGTEPSKSSTLYSGSFTVGSNLQSVVLKAKAYDSSGNASDVVTRNYTFGALASFDVHYKNTGSWSNVYIYLYNKATNAALSGWTWPGVAMTQESTSSWYTYKVTETVEVGIVINNKNSGKQTADLFRTTQGWYDGTWHDACPGDCPVYPVPVLSASKTSSTFSAPFNLTLTATNGGAIYYTTDGSTPTSASTPYSAALTISNTTRVRAIAYNSAGSSNLIDETYTYQEAQPLVLHYKNTGNWANVYVYLYNKATNSALPGWTWPGVAMTQEASSKWYSYTVSESVAVGIVFNNKNSGSQTADLFRSTTGWYDGSWHDACPGDCPVYPVPVLTVSPAGGAYSDSISVSLSATESGKIYYTTDGTTPTQLSTLYASALKLKQSTNLKAKAFNTAGESNLIDPQYTITPSVKTPVLTISPASGTYTGKVTVSLSATQNGVIYYTTDGTAPGLNSSVYSQALSFTADATLRAIAYNSYGNSGEQSAQYTITPIVTPTGDKFTWDNALVYFVLTDRFYNGDPSNDHAYGRGFDGNGVAYDVNSYPSRDAGSFHGGDIKGLIAKLKEGYFEQVGVNAIWISAPYEQIHGWVGGGPNGDFIHYPYHGYYTLDWSEMDQAMGTEADFDEFMSLAHSKGIRVVMDIVLNHVGYTNFADGNAYGYGCWSSAWKSWRPATPTGWHTYHSELIDYTCSNWGNYWGKDWVRHPDIAGYDACSPGGGLTNCVGYLPDIKTEVTTATALPPVLVAKWTKEGVLNQKIAEIDAWFAKTGLVKTPANYIIFWITEWIRKHGVDGLRVDTAKHVELSIWQRLKNEGNRALHEWKDANPDKALDSQDLWMTAEVWGHGPNKSEYHSNGFNSVINFGLKTDARLLGRDATKMESLFSEYASKINSDPNFNVLSYISSHDVTPLYPRDKLKEIAPAFILLPGGVQIFYGDECARPEGTYADTEQNTRSDFSWSTYDNTTLNVFSHLGRFRKAHPSVGAGSHKKISDSPYFFMRDYENATLKIADRVAIAIGASGATTLDVSSVFPDGEAVIDAYTGTQYTVAAGKITVTPASEGIILLEYKNPPAYVVKPVVSVTPESQYSANPIQITIAASDDLNRAFTVYYTTNDALSSSDLASWNVYTAPFSLTASGTLRAVAQTVTGVKSNVVSQRYMIGAIQPFLVHYWAPSCTPNIYTWNAQPSGIMANMTWPGVAMTKEGTDGWYVAAIPALSTNLIFKCGTAQTADLTRDREGWYKDGQWYDNCPGSCPGQQAPLLSIPTASQNFSTGSGTITLTGVGAEAIYYTLDGSTPTAASNLYTGPFMLSGQSTETIVVKAIAYNAAGASAVVSASYTFIPINGFTVYYWSPTCAPKIHIWNALPTGSQPNTTWPGLAMDDVDGTGWYSFFVPANSANLIFNNCSGQTANLSRSTTGWFRNSAWTDACPGDCPATVKFAAETLTDEKTPEFALFPNPTNGILNLYTGLDDTQARITVSSISGMVVFDKIVNENRIQLDLSAMPKGLYFVRYVSDEHVFTQKVILK